jgi:hypothetical protein
MISRHIIFVVTFAAGAIATPVAAYQASSPDPKEIAARLVREFADKCTEEGETDEILCQDAASLFPQSVQVADVKCAAPDMSGSLAATSCTYRLVETYPGRTAAYRCKSGFVASKSFNPLVWTPAGGNAAARARQWLVTWDFARKMDCAAA